MMAHSLGRSANNLPVDRWHPQLEAGGKQKKWTDYEEMQFIQAHQVLGNRWAEISKIIKGR